MVILNKLVVVVVVGIRKPQVISAGGGVRTPCTHPLDPPLYSVARLLGACSLINCDTFGAHKLSEVKVKSAQTDKAINLIVLLTIRLYLKWSLHSYKSR